MKKQTPFEKFIKERLKLSRPKIGFGLLKPDKQILESLKKSKKYAEIILVGPTAIKSVKGFEKIIVKEPEKRLAEMLAKEEVDGIIRGTIDDFKTLETYQSLVGKEKAKNEIELALIEDAFERQFYISEGSNPRGWNRKEKMKQVQGVVKFMQEELGIKPKIGFLTGIRHETYQKRKGSKKWPIKYLNETYEDAEYGVKYFKKRGLKAKNYAIELNAAAEEGCNLIVPPNGMTGNQIFRALCLIGGGKLLTASRANLPHPYEDNSRNEKDFENHVKWLVAWINGQKFKKQKSKI
ncbi:hypothetical protein ES702_01192 [subsurface metagenome]